MILLYFVMFCTEKEEKFANLLRLSEINFFFLWSLARFVFGSMRDAQVQVKRLWMDLRQDLFLLLAHRSSLPFVSASLLPTTCKEVSSCSVFSSLCPLGVFSVSYKCSWCFMLTVQANWN